MSVSNTVIELKFTVIYELLGYFFRILFSETLVLPYDLLTSLQIQNLKKKPLLSKTLGFLVGAARAKNSYSTLLFSPFHCASISKICVYPGLSLSPSISGCLCPTRRHNNTTGTSLRLYITEVSRNHE
jgi:hypothetical protein